MQITELKAYKLYILIGKLNAFIKKYGSAKQAGENDV